MDRYEQVIQLSKRRGFLYPSFEIYEGAAGFYDWGPLGASLLNNVLGVWRQHYVVEEGLMEVSTPTIMPRDVFEASGHLDGFVDPMVTCQGCGESFRADHLVESYVDVVADSLSNERLGELMRENDVRCPECGGEPGEVYDFNLMFGTSMGPGEGREAYLRPETAQGIFVAYPRLHRYAREKLPFGVVQTGRAYRNEVSPRQGVIRLREFSQAEVEIFVDPEEKRHPGFRDVDHRVLNLLPVERQLEGEGATRTRLRDAVEEGWLKDTLFAYHLNVVDRFLESLGIPEGDLRYRQHLPDERAHYAADCWDAEVRLDRFGWIEVVGLADRTDYDLKKHAEHSGHDMTALRPFDEPKTETRREVEVDMASLGPRLKGQAKAAAGALERMVQEGTEPSGDVELDLGGETVTIHEEEYDVVEEEEEVRGEEFVPHVLEPSYGVDRLIYCVLEKAFEAEEVKGRERRVLRFERGLAPVDVAVLPLIDDEELLEISRRLTRRLRGEGFRVDTDTSGNIGRRYRRQDEVGTPLCVTVDPEGLENSEVTVTLRDRDSMEQVRVPLDGIAGRISEFLGGAELGEVAK